ncbi:hypothetical protein [Secundilactobacillus yichangensis]|uniref:hypothetical protein n=1 Tax=Secundilactobacillus yichangensis TaxID=2799580 RepID=UPI001942E6EA|nr:hypothetical protein [Secundilactobacillus yichangensis]
MAIMYKGNKLNNLAYKGQTVGSIYLKGQKIYGYHVSPGIVLWSENKAFISSIEHGVETNFKTASFIKADSTLTLAKPISKLENGLTINVSSSAVISDGSRYETNWKAPDGYKPSVKFSKVDLLSAKWLPFQSTDVGRWQVNVKMINDTILQFQAINDGQKFLNSTNLGNLQISTNQWLIISKVVAY